MKKNPAIQYLYWPVKKRNIHVSVLKKEKNESILELHIIDVFITALDSFKLDQKRAFLSKSYIRKKKFGITSIRDH